MQGILTRCSKYRWTGCNLGSASLRATEMHFEMSNCLFQSVKDIHKLVLTSSSQRKRTRAQPYTSSTAYASSGRRHKSMRYDGWQNELRIERDAIASLHTCHLPKILPPCCLLTAVLSSSPTDRAWIARHFLRSDCHLGSASPDHSELPTRKLKLLNLIIKTSRVTLKDLMLYFKR